MLDFDKRFAMHTSAVQFFAAAYTAGNRSPVTIVSATLFSQGRFCMGWVGLGIFIYSRDPAVPDYDEIGLHAKKSGKFRRLIMGNKYI